MCRIDVAVKMDGTPVNPVMSICSITEPGRVPAKATAPKARPAPRQTPAGPAREPVWLLMQSKLTVNAPGDAYEREADSVASRIMQMPEGERTRRRLDAASDTGAAQRMEGEEETAQAAPLQREQGVDEEEEMQMAALQREAVEEEANAAGRGDSAGEDRPEVPRLPVDEAPGTEEEETPAPAAGEVRRAASGRAPDRTGGNAERGIRAAMAGPGRTLPAPLAAERSSSGGSGKSKGCCAGWGGAGAGAAGDGDAAG